MFILWIMSTNKEVFGQSAVSTNTTTFFFKFSLQVYLIYKFIIKYILYNPLDLIIFVEKNLKGGLGSSSTPLQFYSLLFLRHKDFCGLSAVLGLY